MLRSYLRIALRTLRRRKNYTAVNVLGLTVGLACCALVAVFLQHELSWDTHHPGRTASTAS
jgi:putative ABC transport system permease protein